MDYKLGYYTKVSVEDGEISSITEIIPGERQFHSVYSSSDQKQYWVEDEEKTLCYEAPFAKEAFDHVIMVTFKYLKKDLFFTPEFREIMANLNRDGESFRILQPIVKNVAISIEEKLHKVEFYYHSRISYLNNLMK